MKDFGFYIVIFLVVFNYNFAYNVYVIFYHFEMLSCIIVVCFGDQATVVVK